jgi:DNA invertase Pin-like site-specific DNA recombinase
MGLIDNTPMGRLILTNLLTFAEFERAMIVERTQSGKTIAKQSKALKNVVQKNIPKYNFHALDLLDNNSYNKVAVITGISKSTLIRECRCRKAITPDY